MLITTPLVRVYMSGGAAANAAAASMLVDSRVPSASVSAPPMEDVLQSWQLVTAHDSGMVCVWSEIEGELEEVVRIGQRGASPAKCLAVCEKLGALCAAHLDGSLRVVPVQHYKSSSGGSTVGALTFRWAGPKGRKSSGAVALPHAVIPASK